MKTTLSMLSVLAAAVAPNLAPNLAFAHESLAPHRHPHATSMLAGVEPLGVAVVVLFLAIVAFVTFRRG